MRLAPCALVLIAACSSKKKHDEPPAPPPPPPAPTDAAAPADAPPPPPCIINLVIADPIRYSDGGQLSGEIPRTRGKLDLSALKPVAGTCRGVNLIVEQTTKYGEIIDMFDALVALGFDNLTLGSHEHHQVAQLPAGTTRSSKTNEGRIVGRFEEKPAGEMPVIVVAANKDVTVSGTLVGKAADEHIVTLVAGALRGATTTHTLILQADQSLRQADVFGPIQGADLAGYTNIVFGIATKRK